VDVTDAVQVGRETSELTPAAGALTRRNSKAMRERLGELALMMALVAAVLHPARAFVLFGSRHPVWLTDVLPVTAGGVALDLATFFVTRRETLRDEDVLRWGYLYYVLRPALLAVVPTRLPTLLGFEAPVLTIAYGFVLLFALFLPLDSRRAWQLTTLAVLLQVSVAILSSAIPPSPPLVVRMAAAATVVTFLTWCCTQVAPSVGGRATPGASYHLEFLIRREAYGALWLARHEMLARPAGVRTIHPRRWRMLSRRSMEDLEHFSKAAAALRSPYSATIYDYGVMQNGSLYSVSEFLDGKDLQNHMQRVGSLSLEEALTFALQISESLVEAHSRNLAHRGVVPENVILCRLGRSPRVAKLVKFDLSNMECYLEARQGAVRDRTWDSPERLAGVHVGKPSDVYQLGNLLAFMLTGKPPDTERTEGSPPDPRVPAQIAALIASCTRQSPHERPRVALVRDELECALTTLCGRKARIRALDGLPILPSSQELPTLQSPTRSSSREASPSNFKSNLERPLHAHRRSPQAISDDIREAARGRLAQIALADVAITISLTALARWGVQANPPAARSLTGLIVLTVLSLDLCLWLIAKLREYSTAFALEAGIFFFIARAAISCVGTIYGFAHMGIDPPIMSFAPLMVLLLPLFIPLPPKSLVLPALVTASIEPFSQAFLVPSDFAPLWQTSLLTAVAVLVWSQVLAQVLYGTRQIASEREEFGAYRRGMLIGQGGSGEVWRAKHDVLERDAALKVLRTDDLRPDEREAWLRRFKREAQLTSQLSSPYTVKVYDHGINKSGTAYSVMELLEGEDLSSYVKRVGSLPAEQAVAIALQICDSLAEAHERGLVHRDVKPANVFLVRRGDRVHVKVLDFGLANYAERLSTSAHSTARLLGTPAFMPPEAFLGETIDARSDIYGLGCLLYYALSGRNVFERPSLAAMAMAHVHDEPNPLSASSARPLPKALEFIVHRCLNKAPEDRFQSVEELEAALFSLALEEHPDANHAPSAGSSWSPESAGESASP
jgi:serine/threonine-protein kinase